MKIDFSNRYLRLTLLWVALSTLLYLILWLILSVMGVEDFPISMQIFLVGLAAGYLIYRFFADHIQ